MAINTAEKIETIVNCYLTNQTTVGTFGTLVAVPAFPELSVRSCYRVVTDGLTFIVRTDRHGWQVSFGPMTGCDADLYSAAKMAIDERKGRCVGSMVQALGITTQTEG